MLSGNKVKIVMLVLLLFFLCSCDFFKDEAKSKFDDVEYQLDLSFGTNGTNRIVTEDISLPASMKAVTLTWRSDNLEYLSHDGRVHRGKVDVEVGLSVVLKYNGKTKTVVYNVTVKALEEVTKMYSITFDSQGGSSVDTITEVEGESIVKPVDPKKEGYRFLGWFADVEGSLEFVFDKMPSVDTKLYAKWETIFSVYTITFKSQGGSEVERITGVEGTVIVKPADPHKDGHRFLGWHLDVEGTLDFVFDKMPSKDLTLYANWERILEIHTITFDSQGGSRVESITEVEGTMVVKPVDPTRIGYYFMGWFVDVEQLSMYVFGEMPREDIVLYAGWKKVHTFTFDTQGGSRIDNIKEIEGVKIDKPADPVKEGYRFKGWFIDVDSSLEYDFDLIPTEDKTLYAKWEKVLYAYTITFDSQGGSKVDAITEMEGATVFKPEDPVNEGYHFIGWFIDVKTSVEYNIDTMPSEDITLYAKWKKILYTYTINFDTQGGSNVDGITEIEGTTIYTPLDPVKEGYRFKGWFIDVAQTSMYVFDTMPSEDIVLYAGWKELHTITFDSQGGSRVDSLIEVEGAKISPPSKPTKEGYRFLGWFEEQETTMEYLLNFMPAQSIVLYAKWEEKGTEGLVFYNMNDQYHVVDYIGTDEHVIIPQTHYGQRVVGIGYQAFYNCMNITTIIVPSSVVTISSEAFMGCSSLTSISLPFVGESKDALDNASRFGFIFGQYFYDGSYLVGFGNSRYYIPLSLKEVIITTDTSIGDYAFNECSSLTTITLPKNVAMIGAGAFSYCTSLENITWPESIDHIENNAFYSCDKLRNITLPETLLSIGNNAFSFCTSITSVTIPKRITSIESGVFSACEGLVSVLLPDGIISIGSGAFWECSSLTSIIIPDGVTCIESSAFYGCASLTSITIPNGVTQIDSSTFYECISLSSILIPDTITSIGNHAFYGCSSLTSIVIPDGVTRIQEYAFSNCESLRDIKLSSNLETIDQFAFGGCTSLVNITMPMSVTHIGNNVFSSCSNLTSITVPFLGSNRDMLSHLGYLFGMDNYNESYLANGYYVPLTLNEVAVTDVTVIAKNMFDSCTSLTIITLPDNLFSIEERAFNGCTSLEDIALPQTLLRIGTRAFASCTSLTNITIPDSVVTIENGALYNCNRLETITLPFTGQNRDSTGASAKFSYIFESDMPSPYLKEVILTDTVHVADRAFYGFSSITSITFPDNVTNIGEGAFSFCTGLTSLLLPDSVIKIGDSAFSHCTGLTSIILPDMLTEIGSFAFSECTGLSTFEFPNHLISIGRSAFSGCTGVKSISLPDSLVRIEKSAMYGLSNLESIKIPFVGSDIDQNLSSIFGYIFGDSEFSRSYYANGYYVPTSLKMVVISNATSINSFAFDGCSSINEITLNAGVIDIGESAFKDCTSLTNITIPESVTNISRFAFSGCSNLTSITIPDGVESIGESAFSGCENLSRIVLPFTGQSRAASGSSAHVNYIFGLQKLPSSLREVVLTDSSYIAAGAFSGCTNLTSIVLPDTLVEIKDSAFRSCIGLTTLSLPEGLISIGDMAFSDCRDLTSLIIPNNVTSIGSSTFSSCFGLKSISIPLSLTSIGEGAFSECSNLTNIILPEGLSRIKQSTFYGCRSLTNVTLPIGVTSIDAYAFYGCRSLTSITIPKNVTSIGIGAFGGVNNIQSITLPFTGASRTASGSEAQFAYIFGTTRFENSYVVYSVNNETYYLPSQLKEVIITDEETVKSNSFKGCSGLTSIIMSEHVTSIADFAFSDCTSLTSITIPDGVTSFGESAFSKCTSLTDIRFSDALTSIGNSAFGYCTALKEIRLPKNLKTIGADVFTHCSSLTDIYLPDSLTSIGEAAFDYCASLVKISIPNNISSLANRSFRFCTSLRDVHLPDALNSICDSVFTGCESLININFPEGLKTIGSSAFNGCTSMTSITLPNGLETIGQQAFQSCFLVRTLSIPESVTNIGPRAFAACSSLVLYTNVKGKQVGWDSWFNFTTTHYVPIYYGVDEVYKYMEMEYLIVDQAITITRFMGIDTELEIPTTIYGYDVTTIGFNAFQNSTSLTRIVIPDSITSIEPYAFSRCSNLSFVTLPTKLETLKPYVFYSCSSLTSIDLPNTLSSVGYWTFGYCTALTNIILPNSVKYIEDYAFFGCTSFTNITLPEGLTRIGENVYSGCSNLTHITLPNSLTSIGSFAFNYCTSLIEIKIPDSITSISRGMFIGCTALTTIILPDGIESIGEIAFRNCENLTTIIFPNGMTSIGKNAFDFCSSLKRIIIPKTVTVIGNKAFDYCTTLTIYAEATSEPINWDPQWNPFDRPVVWGYQYY